MEKWTTISGRFTSKEVELIKRFQKKQNLSDNQLVRQGVQIIVSIVSMKELFEGNQTGLEFFRDFASELKTELNSERYQKVLNKTAQRVARKYKEEQLNKFEEEASKITQELEIFNEKRVRGRKPEKRNRGRPIDKGNEVK